MILCCAAIACKKTSVDFTFTPSEPKAGEAVRFSNLSSSGEDWEWTFGDGSTSTLKSPSHVYKKPGTYRVILKVDKKNSLTATKELTVYDTIPTFVANDSVFYIYKDYTFTANVYNPYNYEMDLEWELPVPPVKAESNYITCYFTQADDSAEVSLQITLNGEKTDITKKFYIRDREANSVYMRTAKGDYRQRIFSERSEDAKLLSGSSALLDTEQDTAQTYNGKVFLLSELITIFPELQGFHIANRKIYYRAEGLYVANIDGSYPVQIDATPCAAMTLDTYDNRIYWANAEGVWYMPFVGSDNNKFVTVPTKLNEMNNVTKIAADGKLN